MKALKISLLTSLVLYLVVSYISWDIIWIKRIPSLENHIRFISLVSYVLLQVLAQLFFNNKDLK